MGNAEGADRGPTRCRRRLGGVPAPCVPDTMPVVRPAAAAAVVLAILLSACLSDDDRAGRREPLASPPGAPAAGPASEDRQVTVGGARRTYRLLTPPAGDAVPLVVMLHDAGNTVDGIVQATQLDRAAAGQGFAVALPAAAEASGRTWNAGFCCGPGPAVGLDDVAFLDAVLDDLATDERLDADRVVLAGVSNGAVMAYRYACERAGRVAGVGSVAGTMDPDACRPAEPVAVLEIRGTADDVVPFDGGAMPDFVQASLPAMGAEALVRRWAELNSCAGAPVTTTDPPVTRTTWQGCAAGTTVGLIAVDGGGHTWYAPEFGPVNGAVDASTEILRFFALDG